MSDSSHQVRPASDQKSGVQSQVSQDKILRKIVLREHHSSSVRLQMELRDGLPDEYFVVDQKWFVRWMQEHIVELEGSLEERKVRALEEIARKMGG